MLTRFIKRLNAITIGTILWSMLANVGWTGEKSTILAIDPRLALEVKLWERFEHNPSRHNAALLERWGARTDEFGRIRMFLYFKDAPAGEVAAELSKRGVNLFPHTWVPAVGVHPWGYLIADVPTAELMRLFVDGLVERAAAGCRVLKQLNDATAVHTGAAEVRDHQPRLSGRGVRLAILDSGYQLDHPDLPEPAAAMDYADYPDSNANVTDQVSAHGTHVAGTAFGLGVLSDGRWRGMAPAAEPIYLKIGNDTNGDASSEAVVGAVRATATWLEADIGSMSYGGMDGFNDGTSPEAQAVDLAVGEGVTYFMAAGNSALNRNHYSGSLEANEESDPIQIIVKFASDSAVWALNLAWFDGADTSEHTVMNADIRDGDGNRLDTEFAGQMASPRGTEARLYVFTEFLPRDSVSFFVIVTNQSDREQDFHLQVFSDHYYIRFTQPDPNYTILSPSDADSCISVGAFTSRSRWRDWTGEEHDDRTEIGSIANFSSRGPRYDGRLKPDICAPGRRTISCLNTDIIALNTGWDYIIISNDGEQGEPAQYIALMGTSMASPAAAGSAALTLESNPDLSPPELRALLFQNARRDRFTGETPNTTWGWGKIDIRGTVTVEERREQNPHPVGFKIISAFPNPFNGGLAVDYFTHRAGLMRQSLVDAAGRTVWSRLEYNTGGIHRISLPEPLMNLASGNYIIMMEFNGRRAAVPVALIR